MSHVNLPDNPGHPPAPVVKTDIPESVLDFCASTCICSGLLNFMPHNVSAVEQLESAVLEYSPFVAGGGGDATKLCLT